METTISVVWYHKAEISRLTIEVCVLFQTFPDFSDFFRLILEFENVQEVFTKYTFKEIKIIETYFFSVFDKATLKLHIQKIFFWVLIKQLSFTKIKTRRKDLFFFPIEQNQDNPVDFQLDMFIFNLKEKKIFDLES